jgi:iron complex outermembrane recepter protein
VRRATLVLLVVLLAWAAQGLADEGSPASSPSQGPSLAGSESDTAPAKVTQEVTVTASRMEIPLKESPAATTVVTSGEIDKTIPKGIAAEEALRFVPGVQVDNQADGERVHLSIRGQGLLTERGIRGIKVLLDGLPLNDPTGFAPDLFDVDWPTVDRVEVFRGPSSALYGGGSAGGVINIETRDGGPKKISSDILGEAGSNGFWKALGEVDGTDGDLNYRVSASRGFGDGWRVHTAYHSTNMYGKFRLTPSDGVTLTGIVAGTSFFNENAEGLNLAQLNEDPQQPNPDAITYNELQRTKRGTVGFNGKVALTASSDLQFSAYYRHTLWKEAVPSAVDHRTYDTPGAIFQYNLHGPAGATRWHLSVGTDLDWQSIYEYKRPNEGRANEGDTILADQNIDQRSLGFYAMGRLELGPQWSVVADVRSDDIHNKLEDNLQAGGVDLSGERTFSKVTGRLGASWNPQEHMGFYASIGQGFMPPATEELANNPAHQGGFNESIEAATSLGEELGIRGDVPGQLTYDVAGFYMTTDNDFGRYRVPSRPLETFYRNAGASRRFGLETSLGYFGIRNLAIQLAYTYSDFKYTEIKSLFGNYEDTYIPNTPKHQGYLDVEYLLGSHWLVGVGAEGKSSWYIDQSNATSIHGHVLVHPRVGFRFAAGGYRAEVTASARNVFSKDWVAFTEPDPDGNSYQPGPTRQYYLGARLWLGE